MRNMLACADITVSSVKKDTPTDLLFAGRCLGVLFVTKRMVECIWRVCIEKRRWA